MRLHVLGFPHTQTTREFDHCAFTAKTRKFASMMHDQGHEVTLYAGDENDARCTELVTLITGAEQDDLFSSYGWYRRGEIYGVEWDSSLPYWQLFIGRAITRLRERLGPRDLICLPTGWPLRAIPEAFPDHLTVETGVGYEGTCTPYRVFESYAWMHTVYGAQQGASQADGRFYDTVIPNFYELEEFPAGRGDGGYCAFMSRMTQRKGYGIAVDATARAGVALGIAGIGGDTVEADHVKHVGLMDAAGRARLLGGAIATLVPTLYLEPFGGVAAESLLCGTPVICTDFGAFTEYVGQGQDGFRCRTMKEFTDAINMAPSLDREGIRRRAQERFATGPVAVRYEEYFDRLGTLWGEGFYAP